jgi:hypothetical protein
VYEITKVAYRSRGCAYQELGNTWVDRDALTFLCDKLICLFSLIVTSLPASGGKRKQR